MLGFDNVVLGVRVEAVVVELIEVGRVENGHVDIAVTEQVIDERLFAVAAEFLERPHGVSRAEGTVISVKAFDPALPVFVSPILGVGVPKMHVPVEFWMCVPVIMVHVSLPYLYSRMVQRHRGDAGLVRLGRTNHWPPLQRELCGRPRNRREAAPSRASCLRGRQSRQRRGCSRGRGRLGGSDSAAGPPPLLPRPRPSPAAGPQSSCRTPTPRRGAVRK